MSDSDQGERLGPVPKWARDLCKRVLALSDQRCYEITLIKDGADTRYNVDDKGKLEY